MKERKKEERKKERNMPLEAAVVLKLLGTFVVVDNQVWATHHRKLKELTDARWGLQEHVTC